MQFGTKRIIDSLRSGLRQFGLDPRDWRIVPSRGSSHCLELRHRQDPDLRLKGWLADGQWRELEFSGI